MSNYVKNYEYNGYYLISIPVILLAALFEIFRGAVGVPSSMGDVMSLIIGVDSSSSSSLVKPMLMDFGNLVKRFYRSLKYCLPSFSFRLYQFVVYQRFELDRERPRLDFLSILTT